MNAVRYLYDLRDPSTQLIQVYREERRGTHRTVHQYVSIDGRSALLIMRNGLPRGRQLHECGPPPVVPESTVSWDVPAGPCLFCGYRTMRDGIRNVFSTWDYSAVGFTCPLCAECVMFL